MVQFPKLTTLINTGIAPQRCFFIMEDVIYTFRDQIPEKDLNKLDRLAISQGFSKLEFIIEDEQGWWAWFNGSWEGRLLKKKKGYKKK